MPTTGERTTDQPPSPLLDTVLGHRDGGLYEQPLTELATQLAGSGAVADAITALPTTQTTDALSDRIGIVEDIAFATGDVFATTADGLAAVPEGGQFKVVNASPDVAYDVYRHDAGPVATYVTSELSPAALSAKADAADLLLKADQADLDATDARTAGIDTTDGDPGIYAGDGAALLSFDEAGGLEAVLSQMLIRQIERLSIPSDTSGFVSTSDIVIWSDSMAAAGSGWGPAHFAPLLPDRSVTVFGYGGRKVEAIAAVQGSYAITVGAVTIPASGGVTIVPSEGWLFNGESVAATLEGVPGTVSRASDVYTFTRAEAGTSVPVADGTRLYITTGDNYRAHTALFVVGRNNINSTPGDDASLQAVVDVAVGMVDHLTPSVKHYIFVGVTSKSDERSDGTAAEQEELRKVNRFNDLLRFTVGEDHFFDMQDYMVNRAIFEAIGHGTLPNDGSYPTAQDVLDMASGTVPDTLRADETHYSDPGKTMAARYSRRNFIGRGY